MVEVVFYEKPGCINNTRQKLMLTDAGHRVDARSLLEENWNPAELRRYFKSLPVAQWFNLSAPQVKSGEVVPDEIRGDAAIDMMMLNPLLIRRPLMRVGDVYKVGFDLVEVDKWIGLKEAVGIDDLESCPRDPVNRKYR